MDSSKAEFGASFYIRQGCLKFNAFFCWSPAQANPLNQSWMDWRKISMESWWIWCSWIYSSSRQRYLVPINQGLAYFHMKLNVDFVRSRPSRLVMINYRYFILKSDKKYYMFSPVKLWVCFDMEFKYVQIKCFCKSVTENFITENPEKYSPNVGLEPTTVGLRVQRSTDWASRAWMIFSFTRISNKDHTWNLKGIFAVDEVEVKTIKSVKNLKEYIFRYWALLKYSFDLDK